MVDFHWGFVDLADAEHVAAALSQMASDIVLGSNYFHYVRDPWGSYSEYSADIDYVPVTCDWEGGDQPAEDAFYAWGPNVPEDFVRNYEAT